MRTFMNEAKSLTAIGREIRLLVLEMSARAKAGETGSSLSISDIFAVLFFKTMRIDPKRPNDPKRDRFVLSKGHAAAAYYAALALRGYFPMTWLHGHRMNGGRFHSHPSRGAAPGIEVSTGSLGHGLSIGAGMAEAIKRTRSKVYVLIGDGECDEGSIWEAARYAGRVELPNIVAIVDNNGVQAYPLKKSRTQNLAKQWEACGWEVLKTDGHGTDSLGKALEAARALKCPAVVIARTISGKGVPEIEGTVGAHYFVPTSEAVERMKKLYA